LKDMVDWKGLLCSSDRDEAITALQALDTDLRHNEDHRDLIPILGQLILSSDPELRKRSSWCLGKMGQNKVPAPEALPFLVSLIADQEEEVRENCAWGMGEFAGAGVGDESSLRALEVLLQDPDRDVRGMAAWAVGRLADKMSLSSVPCEELIFILMDDESVYLKKTAQFAWERIQALKG